jgi:hypothetical protein
LRKTVDARKKKSTPSSGDQFRCRAWSSSSACAWRCNYDVDDMLVAGSLTGLVWSGGGLWHICAVKTKVSCTRCAQGKKGACLKGMCDGIVHGQRVPVIASKGYKRTGWCCQCEGGSIAEPGGSASGPWQASAWYGKTCGSIARKNSSASRYRAWLRTHGLSNSPLTKATVVVVVMVTMHGTDERKKECGRRKNWRIVCALETSGIVASSSLLAIVVRGKYERPPGIYGNRAKAGATYRHLVWRCVSSRLTV